MELILFGLLLLVVSAVAVLTQWSDDIKNGQQNYRAAQEELRQLRDSYVKSSNYRPLKRKQITKYSDNETILKYKCQNDIYRNQLLLLGLWYFGSTNPIWSIKPSDIDPHKLADLIINDMPWVVSSTSYDTIKQFELTDREFNASTDFELFNKSIAQSMSNNVSDVAFNRGVHDTIQYLNAVDYPIDISTNNDSINDPSEAPDAHISHFQLEDDMYYEQAEDLNYGDSTVNDAALVHDQNFFPFLMTEPQFNQQPRQDMDMFHSY